MTATIPMQHRRRAATYGKASRKPVSAFGIETADTFAQSPLAGGSSDATNHISPSLDRPTPGLPSTKTAPTSRSARDWPSPRQILYDPAQVLSDTEPKPGLAVRDQHRTLYDVPSSDDSDDVELSARGDKARKRRKVTPKLGSRSVSSHEGAILLQELDERAPHDFRNGKESQFSQHKSQDPVGNRLRNDNEAHPTLIPSIEQCRSNMQPKTHSRTSTSPREEQHEVKPRATREAIQVRKAATTVKRNPKAADQPASMQTEAIERVKRSRFATKREHKSQNLRSTSPILADTTDDIQFSLPEDVCQRTTPPKSSRSASKVTTPRQHKLWSMLLPADVSIISPSTLNLPRLRLSENRGQSSSPEVLPRYTSNVYNGPNRAATAFRRQRIVDTLHNQDEISSDVDTTHAVKSSAAEDDNSEQDDVGHHHDGNDDKTVRSQLATVTSGGRTTDLQATSQSVQCASQPLPNTQGGGVKLTYARQRSYLTENDFGEATALGSPEPEHATGHKSNKRAYLRDSLPGLQQRQCICEDPSDRMGSQGAALRSIHELREAGGNVRLLSELEAILDDIDDNRSSLSLRRSRLVELLRRLEEPPFRELFAEREFELKVLDLLDFKTDPMLRTLAAAAILKLLIGPKTKQTLAHVGSPSVMNHYIELLDIDQEVISMAKTRSLNISRAAQAELKGYWDDLLHSNCWQVKQPASVTPRVLALQCLEHIIRQTRETGNADQVLQRDSIKRIVQLLKLPAYVGSAGRQTAPSAEIQLSVSILESCSIADRTKSERSIWSRKSLDTIAALLQSLDDHFSAVPDTLRTLVLRLYINITNNGPGLCQHFSVPPILRSVFEIVVSHFQLISKESASYVPRLDNLILALGLLINLAEWCDIVPQMMSELQDGRETFLEHFVQLFKSGLDKTAEVSEPLQRLLPELLIWIGVLGARNHH